MPAKPRILPPGSDPSTRDKKGKGNVKRIDLSNGFNKLGDPLSTWKYIRYPDHWKNGTSQFGVENMK